MGPLLPDGPVFHSRSVAVRARRASLEGREGKISGIALSLWLASTAGPIWFVFTVFFLAALVFTTVSAWRRYNTLTGMLQELRSRESHVR